MAESTQPKKTTGIKVTIADTIVVTVVVSLIAFFTFIPGSIPTFKYLSNEYPYIMSGVKFSVLATFGECLALRIVSGHYIKAGFGLIPKMVVWAILGITIKLAFIIFSTGAPTILVTLGLPSAASSDSFSATLLTAFCISLTMNLIYAPMLMTLHKITDLHILAHGGRINSLITPIDIAQILKSIDWNMMYHFVFKKTIPLFWIPAHTITFLLPSEFQIIFAALLGIALGLILALATSEKS